MEKKLVMYEFTLSAPYPDENGVTMQNTAYRIEGWRGEARAYNIKEAVGHILRYELTKKVFEYNHVDIEQIIESIAETQDKVQMIIAVANSLSINFSVKEK